jgi:HlyD family secretion protein
MQEVARSGYARKVRLAPFLLVVLLIGCKKTPPVEYDTSNVDRGRLVAKVTATGTLSALVTVLVGAQVSGRVQELKVDFNSPVKKGQVLARIDPLLFQAAVEQSRANLAAAQGNLAKAQADATNAQLQLTRTRALAEKNLVAPADLDTARAAGDSTKALVEAAKGNLAQARASLNQAETNLTYTTIYSPIDGVVISRAVDVGQTVAAALQAPTLFTIAQDLHRMQVDTSVAESDVGKLNADMPASFRVDAHPGLTFRGKVRQIRNAPQTVQNVVTYDAVIDVDNPEEKLRPGMTANVTFVYASRDNALRIPNPALRFRPAITPVDGGTGGGGRPAHQGPRENSDERVVWVLRNNTPTPVRVQLGVTDGSFTEVLSGELKEGDPVITESRGGATGAPPGGARPGGGVGGMRRMF